jgi:hypothetical protein
VFYFFWTLIQKADVLGDVTKVGCELYALHRNLVFSVAHGKKQAFDLSPTK